MKKHAKKALGHEVSFLGKSVPTLLVVGLFLVGGTSAALLGNFGQITGEAEVNDAAVTLDGTTNAVNWEWNDEADEDLLGNEYYETHILRSNVNQQTQVGLSSVCSRTYGSGPTTDSESSTDSDINWTAVTDNNACDGIQTRFVEYYDNAGATLPTWNGADSCTYTVSDQSALDEKVDGDGTDDATSGESVCLNSNVTGSVDIDVNGVTVTSENDRRNVEGKVLISGADVTLEGVVVSNPSGEFGVAVDSAKGNGSTINNNIIEDVGTDTTTGDTVGIYVEGAADQLDITGNIVRDISADTGSGQGMLIYGRSGNSGASITNVLIKNNLVQRTSSTDAGAYGVHMTYDVDDSEVRKNTLEDIGDGNWAHMVALAGDLDNPDTEAENNEVILNNFEGASTSDSTPTDAIAFEGDADPASTTVRKNNIEGVDIDLVNTVDGTLNGEKNWYGNDGLVTANTGSGSIVADYETKSLPVTLSAQETDKFGAISSFALNLAPGDYNVTTSVLQN